MGIIDGKVKINVAVTVNGKSVTGILVETLNELTYALQKYTIFSTMPVMLVKYRDGRSYASLKLSRCP